MLTRHLYRIDEVKASCKYSLTVKNYTEALFWSLELIDSMMIDELRSIMVSVWFESVGLASFALFIELVHASDEALLEYVGAFCSVGRDASIFSLLALGSLDWRHQPNTVVHSPTTGTDPVQRCLIRALLQGKTLFAWTLLRTAWSWEALEPFIKSQTQPLFDELKQSKYGWYGKAAALCLITEPGSWKPLRLYLDETRVAEWMELEGRRTRRIFKIRSSAILDETERGHTPRNVTNIHEIRDPLTSLYGCAYWDTVAKDFGGWRPIYKNDDSKESFYELYFPDDIPDEWCLADQEKSHGLGLAFDEHTKEERRQRALHSRLGHIPSMGLVSVTREAIKVANPITIYDSEEAQTRWASLQKAWNLEPVIKKIMKVQ